MAFSGGKDSAASVLYLLDQGIPKEKIELWHHDVDGREGSSLMDWPVTRDYCRAFAEALGLKLYFSWKVGGFEREMLRHDALTAPTKFETPEGIKRVGGLKGKPSTRMKFPQVSPDLKVRWCSAYLKIDICSTAIRNQERFIGKRVLVVSGERAEESPARAKYKAFEPDRSDNRNGRKPRHVDRWRPIHQWPEKYVWNIIERHKINPHPAYHIGWGRVSCASCIFGNANQWASLFQIAPLHVQKIVNYERKFKVTINRTKSVMQLIQEGTPYPAINNYKEVAQAVSVIYDDEIITTNWTAPAGAYAESCGPV